MDTCDEWIPVVVTRAKHPELAWREWLREHRLSEHELWSDSPLALLRDIGEQPTYWILKSVLLEHVPNFPLPPASERRPLKPKPITVSPDDMVPLDRFPLEHRWINSNRDPFPASAWAEIRPVTTGKARDVWRNLEPLASLLFGGERAKMPPVFSEPVVAFSAEGDADEVSAKLRKTVSYDNPIVVISWEPDQCVLAPWHVFAEYWDDFCYPSSDDVAIAPLSAAWLLVYSHEEHFVFGLIR